MSEPGKLEQRIEAACEFAEIILDTEAAKELLEFLESEEVREAHARGTKELN